MLVAGVTAAAFGTNCWVLAAGPGQDALVVDPGVGVLADLDAVLREHRLRPVAVLATHGHADHVASVTPLCGEHDAPLWVHADDAYRLRDPFALLRPEVRAMLESQLGPSPSWTEPVDVRLLADGQVLTVAGLELTVDHAPGHTEGSVMFRSPLDGSDRDASALCLSGDVLFAGSIGRCDLAGGDPAAMDRSLAAKVLPLADDVVVLPGHGPTTTIGHERATNPYLRGLGGPAAR